MRYVLENADNEIIGTMTTAKDLFEITIEDITPQARHKLGIKKERSYEIKHTHYNTIAIFDVTEGNGLEAEAIGEIRY